MGWPVAASHTRTVLSTLPEAMRVPSGLNATLDTRRVAGQRLADGLAGGRVPHPHRVVVAAGDDPRAVGAERHAEHRVRVAGQRLRRSGWPVSASHSRTVLSPLPETIRCAVGAERHAVHRVGVAGQRLADGWPVSASHTRTVLSALPEAIRVPSGLNATLVTASVWPVSGWPTVGRCRRPTPAPSCPDCRRRSACRRG